ncbi:MAG: T9SS type A sorting domain-containing protein [Bacteroidota bacterium]
MHKPLPRKSLIRIGLFCLSLLLPALAEKAEAQIALTSGNTLTQDFDGMVNTTLPTGWKMANSSVTTYTGASGTVNRSENTGMPTTGGSYRWGTNGTYDDQAIGAMTSGSYASPNKLMVAYTNNFSGNRLTGYSITAKCERYRVNSGASSVNLQFSLNGTAWTDITGGTGPSDPIITWATGPSAYNFTEPDTQTISSGLVTLTTPVQPGGKIYFSVYFNTGGSNSQALGIDDWEFTPIFTPTSGVTAPTQQARTVTFTNIRNTAFTAHWAAGNGTARVAKINTANNFTVPADGTDPTADSAYATTGQVIFNGDGDSVRVTGLAPGTRYYVRVYEFNGTGSNTAYLSGVTASSGNPGNATTTACPTVRIPSSASICAGDSFVFRNRTLRSAGTYRDTVKYGDNCDSVRVLTLTVTALPSARITYTGSLVLSPGDSVQLSGPAGLTYIWNTGQTTRRIWAHLPGTYVLITTSGACSSSDTVVVTMLQATATQLTRPALSLYPNPATENIQLALPGFSSLQLYSPAGKLLMQQQMTDKAELNLQGISAGVYILRCTNNGHTSLHKLMKQ